MQRDGLQTLFRIVTRRKGLVKTPGKGKAFDLAQAAKADFRAGIPSALVSILQNHYNRGKKTKLKRGYFMGEAEVSRFLCILIKMGEALQNSGAEVFRVEDTLNRIAAAYGAQEVNVFVITSSIVVTLTMPQLPPQTQTRRLRHASGNDLLMLEELNALSRRICAAPPSVEEFQRQLDAILAKRADPRLRLAGSVLAASSFAVFFGGSLWDGLLAGVIAVLVFWMERCLAPFCMNGVEFQFIASFCCGISTLLFCRIGPQLHADKILIGIIMLLIPGIMLTNSIRDILLGDIISGSLRLVEAILMAAVLALGMMAAIWLMGGIA